MNRLQMAEQFRRALQMFAASLTEEQAAEVAAVYDAWKPNEEYKEGQYITYGTNSVGDPQLYKVLQAHTSQEDWTPSASASLFEPIGLDESGVPLWAQPSGAHDAYNIGDIVNYNGVYYKSLVDGNAYSPDVAPSLWEVVPTV